MQTFTFKSTSYLHFTMIFGAGLCLASLLIVDLKLQETNEAYFFIAFLLMLALVYLVAVKNSKQIVCIGMNSTYLDLSWMKLPAFQLRENKMIPWSQIREYHYQPGKDEDSFEIILLNSEKIKFSIDHNKEQKEALHAFSVQFDRYIYDLEDDEVKYLESVKSGYTKNFYQSKFGIGIAFLLGLMVLVFMVYLLLVPELPFQLRTIWGVTGLALAYIQQAWMHNLKKRSAGC